jgi:hypothetical protein
MDGRDELVIVPIGEYQGIKMLRSEAERQGLKYRRLGEKEFAGEVENKMETPVEDKAVAKKSTARKVK